MSIKNNAGYMVNLSELCKISSWKRESVYHRIRAGSLIRQDNGLFDLKNSINAYSLKEAGIKITTKTIEAARAPRSAGRAPKKTGELRKAGGPVNKKEAAAMLELKQLKKWQRLEEAKFLKLKREQKLKALISRELVNATFEEMRKIIHAETKKLYDSIFECVEPLNDSPTDAQRERVLETMREELGPVIEHYDSEISIFLDRINGKDN